tara:strand:+ start:3899 stop:4966 length:1068 start_codon:yes stop_codon:yes gene_type:complete
MINITAPINNLGYGIASFNIIKQLINMKEDVILHPIGPIDQMVDGDFLQGIIKKFNKDDLRLDVPSVKIWHQNDIHTHIGKGSHIGFPIFELDRFTDVEICSMKHNDKIFVCSEWAKNIIEKESYLSHIDVHVVPLGVDSSLFKPSLSNRNTTVFFNCGKWEIRKGHDILVDCFNEAFSEEDDVELWMMCENPFLGDKNNDWIKLYKGSNLGHKIRIIPRQRSQIDVYNIMLQADCGVFPARAEGWNLELLEMMACGKQVIATDYSGHTEFCNDSNTMLVDTPSLETAFDGQWFFGDGLWASIQEEQKLQISEYMRNVHEKKKEGNLSLNREGVISAERLSWRNSANLFLEGINK